MRETRGAILRAAQRLFARRGFGGTSTAAVAKAARVSKASVFHHFRSKQALYDAVLADASASTHASIGLLQPSPHRVADRLAAFITQHLEGLVQNDERTRIALSELLQRGATRHRRVTQRTFLEVHAHLVQVIRADQQEGSIRSDVDPETLATLLFGSNVMYFLTHSYQGNADAAAAGAIERFGEAIARIATRGIAG